MKRLNDILSGLACVCLAVPILSSCGSVMYMSPMPSAPLLEEKADFSAGLKLETPVTIVPFQIDADVSYALSNHVAVQASGQYMQKDCDCFQLGAGYFTRLDGKRVFESYLTVGIGRQVNNPDDPDGLSPLSDKEYTKFCYRQYCIQADYGWKNLTSAHVDCGVALRAGLMHYSLYGTSSGVKEVDIVHNIPIAESMLFCRIGSKAVKFQIELSYSTFSNHIEYRDIPRMVRTPLCATAGLNFNF